MKIIFLILALGLLPFGKIVNAQNLKSTIRTNTYGQFSEQLIREYDKNENLIKQVIKDFRGIDTRVSLYTVDAKGRMIKDSTYNSDNKLIEVCSYEYNDHDDIIVQKRLFLEEDAYYEERYDRTYDSDGNETEVKQFNKEGELVWTYKYKYDAQGNMLRRLSFYKGTVKEEWKKKFKNGNCTIAKLYGYHNDTLKRRLDLFWAHEYDKQGREIKKTAHSVSEHLQNKERTIYDYKYDEKGNRIEERTTKNGNIVSIVKIDNTYW